MNAQHWERMKVALRDDQHADIYDLGKSGKKPVQLVEGGSRRDVLAKALRWVLSYNPSAGS